jgi:hypothetical protein
MADISTYKSPNKARNISILRDYLNGMTMKEIGLKYPGTPRCDWTTGYKKVLTNPHMTPTTVRVVMNNIMCHLYDKPKRIPDPRYSHRVYMLNMPFSAREIRALKEDILKRLGSTCPHCGERI